MFLKDDYGCDHPIAYNSKKLNITELLKKNQDVPSAAHIGVEKTNERLAHFYSWPKMYQTVHNYFRNCHACKTSKAPNYSTRLPLGNFKNSTVPFQRIYDDFLGLYPHNRAGYTHIMVSLHHLTKFIISEPIRAVAKIAVQVLEIRIFNVFGVPECLITDNRSQFIAQVFES